MASSLLVVDVVFFFFLIKRYQTAAHLIRCCLLCQRHTRYFIFLHPHFYVSRKSLPYCPLDEINYYDIHGNSDSTRYCLWTDSRDAEKIISIFQLAFPFSSRYGSHGSFNWPRLISPFILSGMTSFPTTNSCSVKSSVSFTVLWQKFIVKFSRFKV